GGSRWEETRLLNHFAVEVDVETFDLDLLGDAKTDHRVDDLEDDPGDDGAIDEGAGDVVELDQHLVAVAVDEPAAIRRTGWLDRLAGESTGQHGAEGATDRVHAEGV